MSSTYMSRTYGHWDGSCEEFWSAFEKISYEVSEHLGRLIYTRVVTAFTKRDGRFHVGSGYMTSLEHSTI